MNGRTSTRTPSSELPNTGRIPMQEVKLSKDVARKVLATVDAGLVSGLGKPIPGKMCVEAAVNYALGRPHGDDPLQT